MKSVKTSLYGEEPETGYKAFWLGDGRWCVRDILSGHSEIRDLGHSGMWMLPSPCQMEYMESDTGFVEYVEIQS